MRQVPNQTPVVSATAPSWQSPDPCPASGTGRSGLAGEHGWAQDHPAWSRDGSRFTHDASGPGGDRIGSMSPTGGDYLMDVTAGSAGYVGDPTWSPDGGSLAFSGAPIRGMPTRIFVVRGDGSVARLIHDVRDAANPGYSDREPAWSWAE